MTDEQQQDWEEVIARSRDLLSRRHTHFGVSVWNGVLCDVADELERLRAENERLRRERLNLAVEVVHAFRSDDSRIVDASEAVADVLELLADDASGMQWEGLEAALAEHDGRQAGGQDR